MIGCDRDQPHAARGAVRRFQSWLMLTVLVGVVVDEGIFPLNIASAASAQPHSMQHLESGGGGAIPSCATVPEHVPVSDNPNSVPAMGACEELGFSFHAHGASKGSFTGEWIASSQNVCCLSYGRLRHCVFDKPEQSRSDLEQEIQ